MDPSALAQPASPGRSLTVSLLSSIAYNLEVPFYRDCDHVPAHAHVHVQGPCLGKSYIKGERQIIDLKKPNLLFTCEVKWFIFSKKDKYVKNPS